ncbi:PEP-CTERM sorting domain-containing protein [Luteolibacter sp. AS25]|uniref:PEP-CTERM sorting domain-containing protein n=1 Tax=Luteolibacter sp. AS25 TaxID=3135776 RepID=UPI00398B6C4E
MKRATILTAALLALAHPAHSAQIIIDSFSYTGSTTDSSTFDDLSIFGGEMDVNKFIGSGDNLSSYDAAINGSSFSLSNPSTTVTGGSMGLVYDGNDDSATSQAFGLGMDLTGTNALSIDVLSITGSMEIAFTLGPQSPGLSSSASFTVDSAGTYSVAYSSLSNQPNFDPTAIGSIYLAINGVNAGEAISLDNFQAIPEPSTALLSTIAIGLATLRRRR